MIVPMVSIGEMSMGMRLLLMRMSMSVFAPQFNRCVMLVLVVFVMDMFVFMLQGLVSVNREARHFVFRFAAVDAACGRRDALLPLSENVERLRHVGKRIQQPTGCTHRSSKQTGNRLPV